MSSSPPQQVSVLWRNGNPIKVLIREFCWNFKLSSSSTKPPNASSLPQETIAFASRLFQAARDGGSEADELLSAALQRGLPPNLLNDQGNTMVLLAAYHGHASTVRLLLKHKADPNILNDRGQSPLAGAVYKNEREVVEALLDGGADPYIGTPSAIDATQMFSNHELAALFKKGSGTKEDETSPSV